MADIRALRLIGLGFGAITAVVVSVAFLLIAIDGSGATSQTAAPASAVVAY